MKKALITGITGQDGSYLAELLLAKGYEVHGLIRRASTFNTDRIDHLYDDPHDAGRAAVPALRRPDRRRRGWSRCWRRSSRTRSTTWPRRATCGSVFDEPEYTGDTTGMGTTRLLEAIRMIGLDCRFYQASQLGDVRRDARRRRTRRPRSTRARPYGAAKVYGYWMTRNYREAYGMFAVNGILFNHESPRRGETFVTRKITRAVAADQSWACRRGCTWATWTPCRDWGYAPEYVEAMWRMLQHDTPADYVIATGTSYSVARLRRSWRSPTPGWTGRSTSTTTRATSARPRWTR